MHPEGEEVSETEEARIERRVEAIRGLYSSDHDELMLATIRGDIAIADEEQAALRAEVERLTVLTDLDANRIQEIEARALDYYSRAETAEAEVERLTRECLDREATESDARERLRQAEERLAAVNAYADDVIRPSNWPMALDLRAMTAGMRVVAGESND
jgi:hypothetical protein